MHQNKGASRSQNKGMQPHICFCCKNSWNFASKCPNRKKRVHRHRWNVQFQSQPQIPQKINLIIQAKRSFSRQRKCFQWPKSNKREICSPRNWTCTSFCKKFSSFGPFLYNAEFYRCKNFGYNVIACKIGNKFSFHSIANRSCWCIKMTIQKKY